MKRSILIVMIDVMVLSVLSLNVGRGTASSNLLLPVYQYSSIIRRGVEREQEYRLKIEELRLRTELAEQQARDAADLASRHKELQDTTIKQLETVAAREADANERMQDALDKERDAALKAKMAMEKQKAAEENMKRALAQKEEADEAARQAEQKAGEAKVQAEIALQREQEIKARIEKMSAQEAELLAQTEAAGKDLQQTKQERDMSYEKLQLALQAEREAREREKAAFVQAEAERKRAEELLVAAKLAEDRANEAQQRIEASQNYIKALSERVVELRLSSQEYQIKLETEQQTAEELKTKLGAIEEEKQQSVWVQREQALVGCSVNLTKRDRTNNELIPYSQEIFLPVVLINEQAYLVCDHEMLGISWWHVQYGGGLNSVDYRVFPVGTNVPRSLLSGFITADAQVPQVCYLPVGNAAPFAKGLLPAGIKRIKSERIQEALAFSPETPDNSARVEINPMLDERFLNVKPVKNSSLFSRRELRVGDYLLSETGYLIGIMVGDSTCYVIPPDGILASAERIEVPLSADEPDQFVSFVNQARLLRKAVKKTSF